ncbi:MAG: GatB/YqeY domain-containing protein [Burkholderiales bacterium]|nr:GatB/YqeY domain-containing protein [Burkholderiales bacterium]
MSLKTRIAEDMKAALRARESGRLSAIRLLLAAVKQREIDERCELDDAGVIAVIDKLIKQRRESAAQYETAGRPELAAAERAEIEVLKAYLPQPLSSDELDALVRQALSETAAAGARDIGKVMAWLKPHVTGRADMAAVSARVKAALG